MSPRPRARPAVAILPVKQTTQAKSRLAGALSPQQRQTLMLAMFADTLVALRRARRVGRVIVVTGDRDARHRAVADGAEVVSDEGAASHSAAALLGIAALLAATPAGEAPPRALLVPGDCPLLKPREVDALLAPLADRDDAAAGGEATAGEPGITDGASADRELVAGRGSVIVVPDRHGEGTNALVLDPPGVIEPAFGEGSRERHLALAAAAGARAEVRVVPSLALDLDTPDDLLTLRLRLETARGGASETRGALRRIGGWRRATV